MVTYVTDILTATAAYVSGVPTPTRAWQWLRGSTTIAGATTNTYTVTAADLGQPITVNQTETNFLGTASATSAADGVVNTFAPAALFALNEPGVWYDPSDITTLYTDNTGSIPVTAPGQTVGLMLDKSKGLVLGPEVITNNTFTAGNTTGWTLTASATVSSDVLNVSSVSYENFATQSLVGYAGKPVRFKATITRTSGSMNIFVGGQQPGSNININSSVNIDILMLVGSTESVIRFRSEGGFVGTIDNISVRELPGNHATQTILGQRPTYGVVPKNGRRNIYTFSEDFSNAIWAKSTSPGITLTNQGEGVWRLQAGPGEWYLTQALPVSGTHTLSIEVKSNGAGLDGFSLMMQGAFIGGNKTATNEWVRYTVSGTNSASGNAGIVRATSNTAVDILIRFPQLELGSTANPYQRVGSIFDITEVGIPSVGYLAFDGNDKWMVTNTVTPGTDKAQVFVGVNKFGTTSYPVLVELGTGGSGGFVWHGNGLNSSTAYFANYSPPNAVAFFSDGGINQPYVGALLLDRAGTSGALSEIAFRKNGVAISGTQDGSNPDSTGNYLAYPIYIGRRGGTSLPFNGHIYSLIVRFGSNLSAARISAAESWVSTKTQGVTL